MQVSPTKPINQSAVSGGIKVNGGLGSKKSAEVSGGSQGSTSSVHSNNRKALSQLATKNQEWSVLSESQKKLYRLQSMGETFGYAQEALIDVAREMTKKSPDKSRLLYEINAVKQGISGQTQVDENFLPATPNKRSSYTLTSIDLISRREQAEEIRIRMPDNSSVSLNFEPNQAPEENISLLKSALRDYGIKVDVEEGKKAVFTGPDNLMDSPWVFAGDGVRVPAGNPVPTNLKRLPDPLSKLSMAIEDGDMESAQKQLRSLLMDLAHKGKIVRKESDNLLAKNPEVPESLSLENVNSSEELKKMFAEGDEFFKIMGLIGQANASRDNVIDILSLD